MADIRSFFAQGLAIKKQQQPIPTPEGGKNPQASKNENSPGRLGSPLAAAAAPVARKLVHESPASGSVASSQPAKRKRLVRKGGGGRVPQKRAISRGARLPDSDEEEDDDDGDSDGEDDDTSSGYAYRSEEEEEIAEDELVSDAGRGHQPRKKARTTRDDGDDDSAADSGETAVADASMPKEDLAAKFVFKPQAPAAAPAASMTASSRKHVSLNVVASSGGGAAAASATDGVVWPAWLTTERRDGVQRRPGAPDYDDTTLYIPPAQFAKLSGMMSAYWSYKQKHMDQLVFCQWGSFFELFWHDADVAHKELGFSYTNRPSMNLVSVGIPAGSWESNVRALVARGYVCALLTQGNNPLTGAGAPSVFAQPRELSAPGDRRVRVRLTSGTVADWAGADDSGYLVAVKQSAEPAPAGAPPVFGVARVDVTTGELQVGAFVDHRQCTQLEGVLCATPIRELLLEKGAAAAALRALCTRLLPPRTVRQLDPFWPPERTVEAMAADVPAAPAEPPAMWKRLTELAGANGGEQSRGARASLSALGAVLAYVNAAGDQGDEALRDPVTLDRRLNWWPGAGRLSAGDGDEEDDTAAGFGRRRQFCEVSGRALVQLGVLDATVGAHRRGSGSSLLGLIDHCATPFGRRMFRKWVEQPLFADRDQLMARLDAVEDYMFDRWPGAHAVRDTFGRLGDLERRLHQAVAGRTDPAGLSRLLNAFRSAAQLLPTTVPTGSVQPKSPLLRMLLTGTGSDDGHGDDSGGAGFWGSTLMEKIDEMLGMLAQLTELEEKQQQQSQQQQQQEEEVVPEFAALVAALGELRAARAELDQALAAARELTGVRSLYFFGDGQRLSSGDTARLSVSSLLASARNKNHFLVVVTGAADMRRMPNSWNKLRGSAKSAKYTPPASEFDVERLQSAADRVDEARAAAFSLLLRRFAAVPLWSVAVHRLAQIDCLLSLAMASAALRSGGRPACRPTFVARAGAPVFRAKQLRHVVGVPASHDSGFIASDVSLGDDGATTSATMLVTGPNMGGKTTVLRSVGIATVLAQIGCFVPAAELQLSPVDHIAVRMGAADRLGRGESTFMVELLETRDILASTSPRSLALIDELGRGTSTADGYALAFAVTQELARRGVRTLFATHFHRLCELAEGGTVQLAYMGLTAGADDDIKFTYELTPGLCPRSFGPSVARMAGVPVQLVQRAEQVAREHEERADAHADLAAAVGVLGALLQGNAADIVDYCRHIHNRHQFNQVKFD